MIWFVYRKRRCVCVIKESNQWCVCVYGENAVRTTVKNKTMSKVRGEGLPMTPAPHDPTKFTFRRSK